MNETIAKYIQAIGTVLIGIALLVGVILGRNLLTNNVQTHTIVVTGKAVNQFPPNQSVITGTWQAKGASADAASSSVRDTTSKGIDALKQAGLADKDIQTTERMAPHLPRAHHLDFQLPPKIRFKRI